MREVARRLATWRGAPALANEVVPSKEVLCQVWAGTEASGPGSIAVYGTLDTDVIAAWGQPTERKGNVWIYEWCASGCERKATVKLTFEKRDLCLRNEKIGGSWITDIEASGGVSAGTCWIGNERNQEPTCDGCLDSGDVRRCTE